MKRELVAALAGLAIAISVGALFASWEPGPATKSVGIPMQEGRAALATDPMRPAQPGF